jgi:hypothetical protein
LAALASHRATFSIVSLAYGILAHKNAHQLERLFRAVYHPEDVFVLHVDKRAERALHLAADKLAHKYGNVRVLKSRPIVWSGFEMARVQMDAMAEALRIDVQWTHFINLTGQDFPIKSREQIVAFLNASPRTSYISWFDPLKTTYWKNARERVTRHYFESAFMQRVLFFPGIGRRLRKLFNWHARPALPFVRKEIPTEFQYFGGSNHGVFSREAAIYLNEAPKAQQIIQWAKHTLHANEIVFQTVLLNSPLRPYLQNTDLREIDFNPASPHPHIFTIGDFDMLIHSRQLFARKFDEALDGEVLDRLEAHLQTA